jgi:hypothetical protein
MGVNNCTKNVLFGVRASLQSWPDYWYWYYQYRYKGSTTGTGKLPGTTTVISCIGSLVGNADFLGLTLRRPSVEKDR